jgi:hypothetical protein
VHNTGSIGIPVTTDRDNQVVVIRGGINRCVIIL